MKRFSRRDVLRGSTAIAASGAFASVSSAAPPASTVTPQLIAAAKKEGRVVYYTSIDLPVAERIAKAFEAKYPEIAVRVERSGAERVFQRIGQEMRAASTASTWSIRRTPPISSCGSETVCWLPSCPRTSPSTIRPTTEIPTECSQASA